MPSHKNTVATQLLAQKREMSGGEAQCVTHGDSAASLQVEPVGKLVDDGAAGADLSLHLPVTQRLVLQEQVKTQSKIMQLRHWEHLPFFLYNAAAC